MKKPRRKKQKKRSKPVSSAEPLLTKPLRDKFLHFLEYHPARRFSINLRTMFLEFLMCDGSIEASYLQDISYAVFCLIKINEDVQNDCIVSESSQLNDVTDHC